MSAEIQPVHKAVVPVAGMGTRMKPWTNVLPKAMLPLADRLGRVRPVLHWILAEAASGGLTHAAVVVSPGTGGIMQDYISTARQAGAKDLPDDVQFIEQANPRGLGDAVLCAADFVGDEPCIVYLGDHIHFSSLPGESCTAQVVRAYQSCGGVAMIGVQAVDEAGLALVGVCRGELLGDNVYRCTKIIEKPAPDAASKQLVTPGIAKGNYLAHNGIYLLGGEIIGCLRELVADGCDGELGLTDAQQLLLKRHDERYYLKLTAGLTCDVGTPAGYAATQAAAVAD